MLPSTPSQELGELLAYAVAQQRHRRNNGLLDEARHAEDRGDATAVSRVKAAFASLREPGKPEPPNLAQRVADLLNTGADPNEAYCGFRLPRDQWPDYPLHLAVELEDAEACGLLIEAGAQVTRRNRHDQTLLHLAETAGVTRALVQGGARWNAWSPSGRVKSNPTDPTHYWTALHAKAAKACGGAVRVLLEHGADPNECTSTGTPVLHVAVLGLMDTGRTAAFEALLDAGADPTALDPEWSRGTLSERIRDHLSGWPSDRVRPLLERLDRAIYEKLNRSLPSAQTRKSCRL